MKKVLKLTEVKALVEHKNGLRTPNPEKLYFWAIKFTFEAKNRQTKVPIKIINIVESTRLYKQKLNSKHQ